ncbi:MAG: outer membrane beta-barrel protein [Tenuifilaceae bacterium]|jgi:hypothetical protein|nr:outer membrane beta-barrel protein [Tenuifilaceae bacterium]
MKRNIWALTLILLLSLPTFSQAWKSAKLEVYAGVTAFQYFGDIGGAAGDTKLLGLMDINLLRTRPGISLGARYHLTKPIQVKSTFTSGLITQSDVGSRNEERNYAFSTIINELAIMGEYYLIPESDDNYFYNIMQMRGGSTHITRPFSVYLTLGFGGFLYSVTPKASLDPSVNPRSPFEQKSKLATFIPVGGGVKYAFLPSLSLGVEIIGRLTSTNSLDGYDSPLANYNDFYHSILFKVNYKISSNSRGTRPPRR